MSGADKVLARQLVGAAQHVLTNRVVLLLLIYILTCTMSSLSLKNLRLQHFQFIALTPMMIASVSELLELHRKLRCPDAHACGTVILLARLLAMHGVCCLNPAAHILCTPSQCCHVLIVLMVIGCTCLTDGCCGLKSTLCLIVYLIIASTPNRMA